MARPTYKFHMSHLAVHYPDGGRDLIPWIELNRQAGGSKLCFQPDRQTRRKYPQLPRWLCWDSPDRAKRLIGQLKRRDLRRRIDSGTLCETWTVPTLWQGLRWPILAYWGLVVLMFYRLGSSVLPAWQRKGWQLDSLDIIGIVLCFVLFVTITLCTISPFVFIAWPWMRMVRRHPRATEFNASSGGMTVTFEDHTRRMLPWRELVVVRRGSIPELCFTNGDSISFFGRAEDLQRWGRLAAALEKHFCPLQIDPLATVKLANRVTRLLLFCWPVAIGFLLLTRSFLPREDMTLWQEALAISAIIFLLAGAFQLAGRYERFVNADTKRQRAKRRQKQRLSLVASD